MDREESAGTQVSAELMTSMRISRERKTIRETTIKQVDNGYIVTVGCKTLVFESRKRLLDELDRYMRNPAKAEKEYNA